MILTGPTKTPPSPVPFLCVLPPNSWRHRSIVILWLKYNRGKAESRPFLSQIHRTSWLGRIGRTSSLCIWIVGAVEQSSNLGEVLHFWMEFAESCNVCLWIERHDGHVKISRVHCSLWEARNCSILGRWDLPYRLLTFFLIRSERLLHHFWIQYRITFIKYLLCLLQIC